MTENVKSFALKRELGEMEELSGVSRLWRNCRLDWLNFCALDSLTLVARTPR